MSLSSTLTRRSWLVPLACALTAAAVLQGCSSGSGEPDSTATPAPTPSPSPAPRDYAEAEAALQSFVTAVQEERLDDAWALYAASIPGTTAEHRSDRGCDYAAFSFEFPKMRYLFQQLAPLPVIERFGSALGASVVELQVRGVDEAIYLATIARAEPYHSGYQVMFFNSGRPALVPGVPDPFPSPEYPQGFCGIWTGAR